MKTRIKFYFTYKGTPFHGWQRQKNISQTVQEVMETALARLFGQMVHLNASGRTDAGVHARIQVAHADIQTEGLNRYFKNGNYRSLHEGFNSLLPQNIRVLKIEKVPNTFHACNDVQKKTYCYFINPEPVGLPEIKDYTWHLRRGLNWDLMQKSASLWTGTHDFAAYCSSDSTAKTTVRTVYESRFEKVDWPVFGGSQRLYVFRITGSGFLKYMVRSIVGTLVKLGNEKTTPELIRQTLENPDRKQIGQTAPPHGLWLWDILYPK